MRPNKVKQLWRDGQPAFGVWLSACSPFLTEHLAAVGFDWLLDDAEHSAVDLQTMVQMFQAIAQPGNAGHIGTRREASWKRARTSG